MKSHSSASKRMSGPVASSLLVAVRLPFGHEIDVFERYSFGLNREPFARNGYPARPPSARTRCPGLNWSDSPRTGRSVGQAKFFPRVVG